jgi:hypothetical protein
MKEPDKVKSELKGTTLRVYWAVLKKGNEGTGPRELMRELGMSSPSVAAYHLEKLKAMGLVEKSPNGSYAKQENVKAEVFSDFVSVVGMMLPRYFFYSVLFTTMLIAYVIIYPPQLTPQTVISIIFGLTGCAITWAETIRAWLRRPF